MARIGFTVLLDLQDYFSDDRQHSKIYIDTKCSKISDLENKISELFGIKRFHLLSEGHFLPASEDIALLKNGETIRVKPNIPEAQSILLPDTYYDANNVTYKRLSEETIPVRAKKRKTFFEDNDDTVQDVPVVEETREQQSMNIDHSNNKSHELHTSTPNNIEAKNNNNMKNSSSDSMRNQKKSKKNKNKMNNSKSQLVKPIENEHIQSEQTETSLEKSISHISDSKNENLSKNSSKHFQTEDEPFTRPIPYKKAKLKSWSNSSLKTTNIVQIIKAPIDSIEIDLSRFDFIPNDDLPPLKPIDIEKNTLAENLEEDLSIKSQEELQNFANKSQTECNMELMEGHEELTKADQQSLPETLDINFLKGSVSQVLKIEKDSDQSERLESSDSVATSKKVVKLNNNCRKSPNNSNQLLSTNCVTEAEQFKAYNCYPDSELLPTEVMNLFYSSDQTIHSEKGQKNENTELIQPQNSINQLKSRKSHNFLDSLKQVSDLSQTETQNISYLSKEAKEVIEQAKEAIEQAKEVIREYHQSIETSSDSSEDSDVSQTETQNMPDLSNKSSAGNSLEVATTLEQAKEATRWSCQEDKKFDLSQNDVKESRCTSRERWRRKIENLTKDLISKSDHSEKLTTVTHNSLKKNSSDQIEVEKTNGLSNVNENQIITNKNSLDNDAAKNTGYILKDDRLVNKEKIKNTDHINACEINFSNENLKSTNETETVSGSSVYPDIMKVIDEIIENDKQRNKENMGTTDKVNNVKKYTKYSLKDDRLVKKKKIKNTDHINDCEINFSNENLKSTNETETVSGSTVYPDIMKVIDEFIENDKRINKKNMGTTDEVNNVKKYTSCENFSTTSEISLDSTLSHEITADDATVLNPRKRRRRRHRKKTKVEKAPAKQEKTNAFPQHWVEFVPAKPKIHLRFNSSDDDEEMNENVKDHSATSTEKIKILQDVTINPDRNFPVHEMQSKVAVKSVAEDTLVADTHAENTGYCKPPEFSNDGNDIQILLQQKKEELLRTVDSFTLIH